MVKYFFVVQKKRTLSQICQHLAFFVVATFNYRQTSAHNIIGWERSWVEKKKILKSLYDGWYAE